jgi:HSP20 family protein
MTTKALTRVNDIFPDMIEDFFKPWNERFTGNIWGKMMTVPAVNITDNENFFKISLAAPGLTKDDFHINLEGNMLTISCEKEEKKEEKNEKMTRNEYNFSSFERTFTLPEEVNMEKIEAKYIDGVLDLMLPKKEEAKRPMPLKNIKVN